MKDEKQKKAKAKKIKVLLKHKILLKTISDNLGKGMTLGEAMKKCGYSESYSEEPHQVFATESWNELMNQKLPDTLLMKVHLEGLNAADEIVFRGKKLGIFTPDYQTRHKYLDTGYKIKRKYDNTIKITGKLDGISDEDLEGKIAGILSGVIGLVAREGKKSK